MKIKTVKDPFVEELCEVGIRPIVKMLMQFDEFAPPPNVIDKAKWKRDLNHELFSFLSGEEILEHLDHGLYYVIIDLQDNLPEKEVNEIRDEWFRGVEFMSKHLQKLKQECNKEHTITPMTIMDGMHLSEETLNHFFKAGIRYFENKEFKKAANVFMLVTFLDHKRFTPWLLKGLCDKECGDIEVAIQDFTMASIMNIDSPLPYIYSAECCMAIGEYDDAHKFLELASKAIEKIPNVEQTGLKSHVEKLKRTKK